MPLWDGIEIIYKIWGYNLKNNIYVVNFKPLIQVKYKNINEEINN